MNGLELTRALRKIELHTRVLFLAEHNSQSMIDEARSAGAHKNMLSSLML